MSLRAASAAAARAVPRQSARHVAANGAVFQRQKTQQTRQNARSHGGMAAVAGEHGAPRPLYLDMQATTPVDPRVLDAMLPFMTQDFGNAHSRTHQWGWDAHDAVEEARESVAKLINADPKGVVFTSGATESNNIAVKGVPRFMRKKKKHVVTVQTEHKCVLDSGRALEREGFDVTYLPVQQNGIVDLDLLQSSLRDDTALVSVMAVNNEIGVVQPIGEIGAMCRERKIFFHTDAAQAVGKIALDVAAQKIDLMSISGHKVYGPKGIGALYVGRRPRVRLEPVQSGGGQERGIRSGTLPTALCVGLGKACEIAYDERERDNARIRALYDRMLGGIREKIPDIVLNGDEAQRFHGNLNVSFAFVEGESLLMALKDFAVSSGSACTSASLEPSYVLRALGVQEELAHTSIRFGIGRFTTDREVDMLLERLYDQVMRLREMSPLWEMHQEGIDLSKIEWSQEH
jgi:cysteine desulfurase